MNAAGWISVLVVGVAAAPGLRELRRSPVGRRAREAAPGRFAKLSDGVTHYQWLGADSGPVAVCVHGLTTPSFVWTRVAEGLGALGFRVLVYDLYGRGFSDRPWGPQDAEFFTRQLTELLAHEKLNEDITLVGYSMGGAIVSAFAAEQSHRLRRLVLLAPAGMGHELGRTAQWATNWPLIGDWAFHMCYPRFLRKGIEAEAAISPEAAEMEGLLNGQLRRRGYLRSVLSSLRGILRNSQEDEHRQIAKDRLPVTAIWGREDKTIPIRSMSQLAEWNRDVKQVVIDGAGHGLPYSHSAEVIEAFRETWEGPVV